MSFNTNKLVLLFTALSLCLSAKAQKILHFQRIDSYIFVDGQANGKDGKFMIDTGTGVPFFINNNYVPVKSNVTLGQGSVGSGQTFTVCKSDSCSVKFGDFDFGSLKDTFNANLGFIEKDVCPQFLGFIGYGFLSQYKFAINYGDGTITLYQPGSGKTVDTKRHRLLCTIHFTTDDKAPQIALAKGELAGVPVSLTFDTGGSTGSVTLTPETKSLLAKHHALKLCDNWKANLRKLKVAGLKVPELEMLDLKEGSEDQIGLAYEFLKHYISVWDYSTKTIELYL